MASLSATELPPRVLVVMPDQWMRALIRAALREEGYDAIGSRGVREAFRLRPDDPERGVLRAMVVDHDALSASAGTLMPRLRERLGAPDTILIRRATRALPDGDWRQVLQRPVSVEDVVDAIRGVAPLPERARHPIDT